MLFQLTFCANFIHVVDVFVGITIESDISMQLSFNYWTILWEWWNTELEDEKPTKQSFEIV